MSNIKSSILKRYSRDHLLVYLVLFPCQGGQLLLVEKAITKFRPCLHKHVFDLKRSCLNTFLPFVYTETSKNEYVHKK